LVIADVSEFGFDLQVPINNAQHCVREHDSIQQRAEAGACADILIGTMTASKKIERRS